MLRNNCQSFGAWLNWCFPLVLLKSWKVSKSGGYDGIRVLLGHMLGKLLYANSTDVQQKCVSDLSGEVKAAEKGDCLYTVL